MRLRITESQYNKILNSLNEVKVNNYNNIFQGVGVDDVLQLVLSNGDVLRFSVTKIDSGVIHLESANARSTNTGYDFLINKTDALKNDALIFQRAPKKGGNSEYKPWTVKGVKSIGVFTEDNTNKTLLTIGEPQNAEIANEPEKPIDKPEEGDEEYAEYLKEVSNVINRLKTMKPNNTYTLTNGAQDKFTIDIISVDEEEIKLSLKSATKSTGEELTDYNTKKNVPATLQLDTDSISIDSDGRFDIVLLVGDSDEFTISDIVDFTDNTTDNTETTTTKKATLAAIERSPELKKAFFHQPTLWGLINVGNPVGISVANKIMNKYNSLDQDYFKQGNTITFAPVETIGLLENDVVYEGIVKNKEGVITITQKSGKRPNKFFWKLRVDNSNDDGSFDVKYYQYQQQSGGGYKVINTAIGKIKKAD